MDTAMLVGRLDIGRGETKTINTQGYGKQWGKTAEPNHAKNLK